MISMAAIVNGNLPEVWSLLDAPGAAPAIFEGEEAMALSIACVHAGSHPNLEMRRIAAIVSSRVLRFSCGPAYSVVSSSVLLSPLTRLSCAPAAAAAAYLEIPISESWLSRPPAVGALGTGSPRKMRAKSARNSSDGAGGYSFRA